MAELRPVFTITYGSGLPLPIQAPENVPVRQFQVGDQKQISTVIREIIPPHAMIIIDVKAFQGHSINARDYAKAIREAHEEKPLILFLRYGAPSDNTIDGDRDAGANDVLYHSSVTEASDVQRMNHFIREGTLPPPPEKKRSPGNAADLINALNRRARHTSGPTRTDASAHSPGSHKKPSPPGKSAEKHIASTPPETPASGDQEMEAFLAAFRTITEQNAQILAGLEGIQESIRNLLTQRKEVLLAEAQARVNDMFAQLRENTGIPAKESPVSSDATVSGAPVVESSIGAATSTPKETPRIAITTKGEPFMTNVSLFGKTVPLGHHSADLFAHLVNTGETLGPADIASLYGLSYQGGYARITTLLINLNEFRNGLPSCLTPVKSGRSTCYRFDEVSFRKAFGMK